MSPFRVPVKIDREMIIHECAGDAIHLSKLFCEILLREINPPHSPTTRAIRAQTRMQPSNGAALILDAALKGSSLPNIAPVPHINH